MASAGPRHGILCVLAALLLAAMPAGGTHQAAEAHSLSVERATMRLVQRPDVTDVEPFYELGQPTPFGAYCGTGEITKDPGNQSFSFDDSRFDNGCGEALLDVRIPPGATRALIAFAADRIITEQVNPTAPVSVLQEFRVKNLAGDLELSKEYFDDTAGSSPFENFTFDEPLPAGTDEVIVLSWLFVDQGAQNALDQRVNGLQSFDATVRNITVTWPAVALPPPTTVQEDEILDEEAREGRANFTVTVDVPDVVVQAGTSASVNLAIAHGPEVLAVVAPNGQTLDEGFAQTDDGSQLVVTLSNQTLADQGPGQYAFTFQTVRDLPAPPAPDEPTYIYPFYYALALLPLVAAVLALHQASIYVRQAEGSYRRTAWPVLVAIILVVGYYLLLLGYSFFGIGPTRMSTTPLEREPLLIYIQFVLLLLMLAFAALAVSRTLISNMRRDLAERARKEDQLRRSNEELERFAYVASHDLQEPLRKVAGFTALLQKRYEGRLDKDADEIIQYAVDGATRMQMLIKDILAYSRVGSKELHRVPVDANATMQLVASDLGEPIKEQRAVVHWEPLPTVRVDASQLRQILQNLVENAVKYRHPKRRPRIDVRAYEDGADWHFEVQDNGQGIPADKHEEIFGIFRRLHGQDQPGTGIGLAVAKKAVERHGGKIWVDSKPGRGSTFHFTLPRGALDAPGWRAALNRAGERRPASG